MEEFGSRKIGLQSHFYKRTWEREGKLINKFHFLPLGARVAVHLAELSALSGVYSCV